MPFSTATLTAVQAQMANMPIDKIKQLLQAVDVVGGTVVNTAGVITVGGRGLTNWEYYQISEFITPMF